MKTKGTAQGVRETDGDSRTGMSLGNPDLQDKRAGVEEKVEAKE